MDTGPKGTAQAGTRDILAGTRWTHCPQSEGPLLCWHHSGEKALMRMEAGLGTWNKIQTDLKKMNMEATCTREYQVLQTP